VEFTPNPALDECIEIYQTLPDGIVVDGLTLERGGPRNWTVRAANGDLAQFGNVERMLEWMRKCASKEM
jgi:hypothetical protein